MISDKQLEKFQKIWEEQFGEKISRAKALEEGTKLINLVGAVYEPITKKQYQELLEYKRKNNI